MYLRSCLLIISDKSSLQRKLHFFLKSGYQVMASLILFGVGKLVKIAVNLFTNEPESFFRVITK